MTNSPPIPLRDYLFLLSVPAHILTLKRKGGHALSIVSCAEKLRSPTFGFPSPVAFISLYFFLFPNFHGLKQDLIKAQRLFHTDPYLTLKERLLTPSPGAPLFPLILTREESHACF